MLEGGVLLMQDESFQRDVGEIMSVRNAGPGVNGDGTGPTKPRLRPPQR